MQRNHPDTECRLFQVLDLSIDLDRQTVRRDNTELELPELSFRLLAALVNSAPDRMTKDELIRDVWDDVVVSDETLAQRVSLLRQALGDDSQNPRYLAAVRGRGYRLVCPVSVIPINQARRPAYYRLPISLTLAFLFVAGLWLFNNWQYERDIDGTDLRIRSIAVLPFTDISATQDNQHFADGMQEELLTRLTAIADLEVISRTSVEKFRSTDRDISEIATRIGADTIIEGSVRIAENRVRITVQHIDAHTDRHLWAENYDGELTVANIFSIQEEVADQIALALESDYRDEQRHATDQQPTDNLEAYEAYLLGRYHTFRQTPDNLERAVEYLEAATSLDNQFAEAYAALGYAYSFLGTTYGSRSPVDSFPHARKAALRALSLNANLANARDLYADILTWYDWDFTTAEQEYLKVLNLEPNSTLGYALFLSTQLRHDEATTMIDRYVAAYPNSEFGHVNAAWRYRSAGDFDKAIKAALAAGDHPDARAALGFSYLSAGNIERAIQIFEADVQTNGRQPAQLSNLATAYFTGELSEKGQALLAELHGIADETYVSPSLLAAVYFSAGDADSGFTKLEEAVAIRAREVIFLQVDYALLGYRDDPRYFALLKKIGLDQS